MAVALRTLPHASSLRSRSSYMAAQSGASHAGADAGAGPAPSPRTQGPGSRPRSASSCCRRATSLSRAARRSFCFFLQRLGGGWSGGRSTWLDVSYVLSFSKNIVPLFMLRPKGSYDKCAASQLLERVQCCTALPCK